MSSIQDVINAAYRVKQSSKDVQTRTLTCANSLQQHAQRLEPTVRGSKTGEDAVREVKEAERAVRECAAKLLAMQTEMERFIRDLSK